MFWAINENPETAVLLVPDFKDCLTLFKYFNGEISAHQ